MVMDFEKVLPSFRYRKAAADMIVDFQPNAFITLAFNRNTSVDAARAKLGEFHNRLDKCVFGRNWWRCARNRSSYVAVIEHPDTNLHLHIAFRLPPDRFCVVSGCAAKIWRRLVPGGSVAVAEIHDLPGMAKYMVKELYPSSSDMVLLSN